MLKNIDVRIKVKDELGITWTELAEHLGVKLLVLSSALNFAEWDVQEKEKIIEIAKMVKELKNKNKEE